MNLIVRLLLTCASLPEKNEGSQEKRGNLNFNEAHYNLWIKEELPEIW